MPPRSKKKPAPKIVPNHPASNEEAREPDQSQSLPSTEPLLSNSRLNANAIANANFWRSLDSGASIISPTDKFRRRARYKGKNVEEVSEKYALHANAGHQRVLVLQYPEQKSRSIYNAANGQQPLEIRMKPRSGVVEVDVPLDTKANYSKLKGAEFGAALRRTRISNQNNAFGLAGGLDAVPARRSLAGNDIVMDNLLASDDHGNPREEECLLDRFTLGGRIESFKDGDPIYMVSTFSGSKCQWTKVDAIVQLRAQFSHLNALHADKNSIASTQKERQDDKARQDRVEDVNMMVKDPGDSENADMYGGMNETSKLLRSIRDEPWQRLRWADSSTRASHRMYKESLEPQKLANSPFYVAKMTNLQYLDAISCPRVDSVTQGRQITAFLRGDEATSILASTLSTFNHDLHDDGSEDEGPSFPAQRAQYGFSKGTPRPDASTERTIEKVCRMICLTTDTVSQKVEQRFLEKFKESPKYSFLRPNNEYHAFYLWRLAQNKAGQGIASEDDHR